MLNQTTTKPAIVFESYVQAVLYEIELCGQISDGHWENASPRDHYKCMCDAHVRYEGRRKDEEAGVQGFRPRRRYNFAAKPLLDVVGTRMLAYARLAKAGLPLEMIRLIERGVIDLYGAVRTEIRDDLTGPYWDKLRTLVAVLNTEAIRAIATDEAAYSMADLRSDLRSMSAIVNAPKYN